MFKAIYKSFEENEPASGYWDQRLIGDILNFLKIEPEILEFGNDCLFDDGILVISGRQNCKRINEINEYIKKMDWVILIVTGDEENVFPIDKIKHDNCIIYQQTAKTNTIADRYIPLGYAQRVDNYVDNLKYDFVFVGQNTHKKRYDWIGEMQKRLGGIVISTNGFAKGIEPNQYMDLLQIAKVLPSPSGPVIPETFRMYEALETGNLPLIPKDDTYWSRLFNNCPIPQIEKAKDLNGNIDYFVDTFPLKQNEVFAWWIQEKLKIRRNLIEDIHRLSGYDLTNNLSVIIPTSPILSHPNTKIIEETLNSLDKLGSIDIYLLIDGIREEQGKFKDNYNLYIRNILKIANRSENIYPIIFNEHTHQVAMTRKALELINSDYVLFIEHDTPLCENIPLNEIFIMLQTQDANVVRLNHEALVLPEHEFLYLSDPIKYNNELFRKTIQWSQRPHFARTEFYREILNKYFSKIAKCMIEDGIHGHPIEDYKRKGMSGWNDWRIWTYTPPRDQKRSYTTDGRKTEPKFDNSFIY